MDAGKVSDGVLKQREVLCDVEKEADLGANSSQEI